MRPAVPVPPLTLVALFVSAVWLWASPSAWGATTPTTSASTLAQAVAGTPGLVTGSAWQDVGAGAAPSSPTANGVVTGQGPSGFPTAGPSFGVLTTGTVELLDHDTNTSSSAGSHNSTSARGVHDVSVLRLDLNVAAGQQCLSVDLQFLSEEFPEYVGSTYNDAAIVELDQNSWSTSGSTVNAPANFAFDDEGDPLTVNSARFVADDHATAEYDGNTVLLTASTPITPGAHTVYVTVFDAGDHGYDSALLVDNLRTTKATGDSCDSGATVADDDGDGLPNRWEIEGYDHGEDGTVDVDLPAMGADPQHKDLFVETDAMENLRLSNTALSKVASAFAAAPVGNPDGKDGITLHVDNGGSSVMNPKTGATWGTRSRSQVVPFQKSLGSFNGDNYDWSAFDGIRSSYFDQARRPIFRYNLSINRYAGSGSSGIARGITSSDFIVSLGSWCGQEGKCPGSENAQTGTFMHELGHTLGLKHGGGDHIQAKPNYLSIMNYDFQIGGLVGPKKWDYSRFGPGQISSLWEGSMDETFGFGVNPGAPAWGYSTLIRCNSGFLGLSSTFEKRAIARNVDLDCDGNASETNVKNDLNDENGDNEVLHAFDDWPALAFAGGAVGGPGRDELRESETVADEPTMAELAAPQLVITPAPEARTLGTEATAGSAVVRGDYASAEPAKGTFWFGPASEAELASQTAPTTLQPGSGQWSSTLTDLTPSTTYRYRATIETDDHIIVGADGTFTTPAAPVAAPIVFAPPKAPIVPSNPACTPPKLGKSTFKAKLAKRDRSGRKNVSLTLSKQPGKGKKQTAVRLSQSCKVLATGTLKGKKLRLTVASDGVTKTKSGKSKPRYPALVGTFELATPTQTVRLTLK